MRYDMARPGWQHRRQQQVRFVLTAIGYTVFLLFLFVAFPMAVFVLGAAMDATP
jgi:hypothetical protein